MYESPINFVFSDIQMQVVKQQENEAYMAVQKCGVDVDREELMRALQYDREQYEKGYKDGRKDAVVEFIKYLKDNSSVCPVCSFLNCDEIYVKDLDYFAEDFLKYNQY